MNQNNTTTRLLRSLLPVSALVLAAPVATTALRAQAVESAVAEAKGDALKAMLKELDVQIDRLDDFIDNAPTAADKAAAKARIAALKERRSELRKNYVQARYDSLKADVQTEYKKLSAWAKRTFSSKPEAKVERAAEDAADKARAHAARAADVANDAAARAKAATNQAAAAASSDLAAYKANPTDEAKADVKASLALLDAEIERLDERCDRLPRGKERDATKLRIKALKERRSELASDFRKARFDTLMADVKAEWNKFIN